jgi:threonine synthase
VPGSFDDAQHILKTLFADREFVDRVALSAVNSINIARILAQCVYYLWAVLKLRSRGVREVEFVVPTGNFGNVLAGWLLGRMGVEGMRFCVATNRNDILFRFFQTGEYRGGVVEPSLAPSMDIQVASNFERYVYFLENGDPENVRAAMASIAAGQGYRSEHPALGTIRSIRVDDSEISSVIEKVHQEYGYICDPHTACALAVPSTNVPQIVLATASPAKFPETVEKAVGIFPTHPTLEKLLEHTGRRFEIAVDPAAIKAFVEANFR